MKCGAEGCVIDLGSWKMGVLTETREEGQVETMSAEADRSLHCFRNSSEQVERLVISIQLHSTPVFDKLIWTRDWGYEDDVRAFLGMVEVPGRPWSSWSIEGEGPTRIYLTTIGCGIGICIN